MVTEVSMGLWKKKKKVLNKETQRQVKSVPDIFNN
jgi:hypothetical protein